MLYSYFKDPRFQPHQVAKSGSRKKADGNEPKLQGRREGITLTSFQWWQIDSLKDIYAPTVPEVIRRIVLDWLEKNHDEIEKQKQAYKEYLNQSSK